MFGQTVPSELRNKFAMSVRQPIGVCGIITAWNFPIAVPSWKILPALVCGNTVVFKPAEEAPLSAINFVQTLVDAGVPPGVVNLVTGDGPGAAAPMLTDPDVRVMSFTGSTATGRLINEQCAATFKKVHLEMGGKNVILVMDDANLDLAIDGCVWGGFGTTGQRCTAASRVVVHKKVYAEFVERFVGARAGAAGGRRAGSVDRDGPVDQRGAADEGDGVRRDRQGRRRAAADGRQPADVGRAREGLLPRADDLRRRRRRGCGSRGRRSSGRWCR